MNDLAGPKLAALARRRSGATFVGVTGSSGKSTTVALLSHALRGNHAVAMQLFHNTMFSLPKTLRGVPAGTEFVVTELGVQGPGTMRPMAALLCPDIAVVTRIALEHYSAFRSLAAIGREKGELLEFVANDGLAILNADDPHVMAMAARCRGRVVTFGWNEGADYRVLAAEGVFPDRLAVRIRTPEGIVDLRTPFAGEHFWLATAAAFATLCELGVDHAAAAERFASFEPPYDRFAAHSFANGPNFLLDAVKAPNDSIPTAIAMLARARAPFKRVVLGHISDYAGSSRKPYREAYRLAAAAADEVIFVGENSHRANAPEEHRRNGRFREFATTREAAEHIRRTARPGELILVKGSRNLHLERIVLEWTREIRCWEHKCGNTLDCTKCGLFAVPFEDHARIRRDERRRRKYGWLQALLPGRKPSRKPNG